MELHWVERRRQGLSVKEWDAKLGEHIISVMQVRGRPASLLVLGCGNLMYWEKISEYSSVDEAKDDAFRAFASWRLSK